ncbi:unnamed protein product [Hymenolepis diminuta]|uniref:long-chain-fatty-acid--CoA ligase n=1 Tax=Hymenolepis diminuta TaxID=6216 RepID=A0A564YUQ3_HYMDI|nr:unnamed protein product [Hymenolepis diminuta]
MYVVYIGGKIGFYSGSVATVSDDMKVLKPTVFTTVPRLLCRIFDAITQKVSKSPFKKFLLKYVLKEKCHQVDKQVFKNNSIWDTLVFSRIRSKFGGNLRLVLVAGAPVSPPVLRFMRAVFSCPVIDGYGCTELCGPASASYGGDLGGGHVGSPYPCVEIKLGDVPEMDLVALRDNKGEICVRGASCVRGYYKNPEASMQLIDGDGWLHTGDVGIWADGCLKVVDRCKHIFKLAQGEYVAPEKLEQVYQNSPLIAQIFVDGNSQSTFPVALVIPDADALNKALAKYSTRHSSESPNNYSIHEMCEDHFSKKIIMQEMQKLAEKAGFMGFEKVKNIKLLADPFTIENSLLTPTLKVSRLQVRKAYAGVLADLYMQGPFI